MQGAWAGRPAGLGTNWGWGHSTERAGHPRPDFQGVGPLAGAATLLTSGSMSLCGPGVVSLATQISGLLVLRPQTSARGSLQAATWPAKPDPTQAHTGGRMHPLSLGGRFCWGQQMDLGPQTTPPPEPVSEGAREPARPASREADPNYEKLFILTPSTEQIPVKHTK